jgi:hypothetical protein
MINLRLLICLIVGAKLLVIDGRLEAQVPDPKETPTIYRAASEAFANRNWKDACELFEQVTCLRPGTPLALEAGFYELLAIRNRILAEPDLYDALFENKAQEWLCVGEEWLTSERSKPFPEYAAKLSDRRKTIRILEFQASFKASQWRRTLSLLSLEESQQADRLEPNRTHLELRLECLVQLQRWHEAEKSTEMLQIMAEEKLAQSPPPAWIERFWLRKAEVDMVLGKWKDAESTVWKIRTHFPECNVSAQVDYVLARCLVHDARFEEARRLLASILANQNQPSAELQTKAWWTIAETHLMQRNLPAAYAAYECVAKLGADSPWAALAQRQMALCQQASGDSVATGIAPSDGNSLRSTQKQTPKQSR